MNMENEMIKAAWAAGVIASLEKDGRQHVWNDLSESYIEALLYSLCPELEKKDESFWTIERLREMFDKAHNNVQNIEKQKD